MMGIAFLVTCLSYSYFCIVRSIIVCSRRNKYTTTTFCWNQLAFCQAWLLNEYVTRRCVDVFLSRLQRHTVEDIESCTSDIMENIPNGDLSQHSQCTHLPGKHDFYTSFHVAVTVSSDLFATAIGVLISGDSWPKGILVRRYFHI